MTFSAKIDRNLWNQEAAVESTRLFSRRSLLLAATGGTITCSVGSNFVHGVEPPRRGRSQPTANRLDRRGKVYRTEQQWRQILTQEQFHVLRRSGTEPAYRNRYFHLTAKGTYVCAGCGSRLFSSTAKYDSGTGWPSFFQPVHRSAVVETTEQTLLLRRRTEVSCRRCDGHLGHVFKDGPWPTGLRYCINSAALKFAPAPTKHR